MAPAVILLDTNVVSEMMRPEPSHAVARWFARVAPSTLQITAVTEAELRVGIEMLPQGRRRDALAAGMERALALLSPQHPLPFDSAAAAHYAAHVGRRRKAGRPVSTMDAQIAAIALSRGFALATRNVKDFEGCGLTLIDPWSGAAAESP